MTRRVVLAFALMMSAAPLAAQTQPPASASNSEGGAFLPRYAFHLNAAHLSGDDPRFVWDTDFGGELDFVDLGYARVTFYANYEAILGEQFRQFDPSHGNYVLGGVLTTRLKRVDIGGVFHHTSRHLSDRPKPFAVDWNMVGGRIATAGSRGRLDYQVGAELRGVILRSYVDYDWEIESAVRVLHRATPVVGLIARSGIHLLGTDGSRSRGRQTGFREEGGVRLTGGRAAVELFAAVERRIDPDPLDFDTATWFTAGFRLLSK